MLKILLIEDDLVDRRAIRRTLAKAGLEAEIFEAQSGKEGLKAFGEEKFDCILLDFRLPDMDGLEFLRCLKADFDERVQPVIILTGLEFDTVALETLRAGAQGFLEKGEINPLRLAHAIQSAIERQQLMIKNREIQVKMQMLSDNATDIIMLHGPGGEINYISRAVKKHLGIEPKKIVGRESMGVIHPEDMKTLRREWDKTVLIEARAFQRDLRYRNKRGEYLWFECISEPVRNGDGKVIGAVTCSRNIDEIKKAETEAMQMGRIIEDSLNEIYVIDAKTLKYTLTNRGARKNLGYSEKELSKMTPLDINPTLNKKTIAELLEPLRSGKKGLISFESKHKRKDGSLYDIYAQVQLARIGDQEVFVAIEEDITEKKKARAEAAESEIKFRLLTEYSSDIIMQRTKDDEILYVSPSVKTHLGFEPEEFKGRKSWELVHPDDRHKFEAWQKTVFDRGKRFTTRMRVLTGEGDYKWFDSVTDPIKNEKGKVISAVTASRNIDEQMKAEEKVRQTQKMEAIGNLTGGIAHDFNNLLTAILGSLQYLKMISDKLPDEAADLIDIALNSGQKGADLTKRLLALSRKQDLKPTVFGVNALVKHLSPLLKRTIRENVEIEARLLDKEAFIEADQGELENALLNMAVNAKDAMPKGGHLNFEISRERLSERNSNLKEVTPGDYVIISVSDTGEGIPADIRDKIFEPFFTTKDVGKGTGLGLSMVYGLVRQSGGHISVYSEEGKGTTFKLYFKETSPKKATKARKPAKADLGKKEQGTILLVEDDDGVRTFVTKALKAKGYTVLVAENGPDALTLITKHPGIDLLLTDVVLPKGMSGVEIAKEFQKTHPKGGIILSSGYTGTTIQKSGWLEQEVDLLAKPFDLEVLLDRVRREIRKSRK